MLDGSYLGHPLRRAMRRKSAAVVANDLLLEHIMITELIDRAFVLVTLAATLLIPFRPMSAQFTPRTSPTHAPSTSPKSVSRPIVAPNPDLPAILRNVGVTDTQSRSIISILARYQSQRDAIISQRGPQAKTGALGPKVDRAVLTERLRMLAQSERTEIDSVLTPAQIAAYQDIIARSNRRRSTPTHT